MINRTRRYTMPDENTNDETIPQDLISNGWFNDDGTIGETGLDFLSVQDFT